MTVIQRHQSNQRLSRIVTHNAVAYLAGVTASNRKAEIEDQTLEVLTKIDIYLASVGSDRSKLLSAQIWLRDIERDFPGMNAAWEAWLGATAPPARATCEAKLASPDLLVEIIVTAAF